MQLKFLLCLTMFVSPVKHFSLFKLPILLISHHMEKCCEETLSNSPLSLLSVVCLSHCSIPVQLLKSSDLGRHSLLYLKEIGHGWFGKVADASVSLFLGETTVFQDCWNLHSSPYLLGPAG